MRKLRFFLLLAVLAMSFATVLPAKVSKMQSVSAKGWDGAFCVYGDIEPGCLINGYGAFCTFESFGDNYVYAVPINEKSCEFSTKYYRLPL